MPRISRLATLLGFALTAAALIGNGAMTAANIAGLMRANRQLDRAGDLINELEHSQSLLRDAESSLRGHLLTADASDMSRFESDAAELGKTLDRLAGVAADDPAQQRRVEDLGQAVGVYLSALRRIAAAGTVTGRDAMANQRKKAEAEQRVADVWNSEDDKIVARLVARDSAVAWAGYSLAIFTGLALIMLATAWVLARRELATRQRAIEAERATREAAQAASQAKDRMLAVVGHELRTPLTPILIEVSSLLRSESHPELRPALESIRGHIELEVRLIDDLIDLALLEQGRLRLERRLIDVHEAIGVAVEVCHGSGLFQGRRLELDLTARRHFVEGDSTRLQQIVWNLLRNASNHVPPGGTIGVRTSDEPAGADGHGTLVVEVSDDGAGIAEAEMTRIFTAFERGSTEGRPGGLGLGLSIAQLLAEAHGGLITAISAGPGRGATFKLRLPASRFIPGIDHAALAEPPPMTAGPIRVLLVEDHPASREAIATALRRQGYQVRDVGRIAEALRAAAGWEFDVMVSDIELPDGSGVELMSILACSGTRAIALSGCATEDDRRRSMDAGFAEHLAKPVTFEALELAISRVVASTTPRRGSAVTSS
jgi:signal transduction histidine kinase/CheY-like chemotaxis protein